MPRQHLERCLQGLPPPAQQSRWDQTVRRREPMQFRKQAPCGEFHQSGCRVKPKPAAGPPDAIAARDPSAVSRQGVQSGDALGAGRPAELFHHRWFKGQQRQYVIHIGPHGSRAARPPCPHGRTDIVDDRNGARARPHAFRYAMGEVRTVYDDQGIGLCGYDRVGCFTNASQDFWQARRDCAKTNDREITQREKARHACGRHVSTADAGKLCASVGPLPDRRDECSTQPITGFFPGDQKNVGTHGSVPDGTPTTKIAFRSASSTSRTGSATMVLPASTAMPASPLERRLRPSAGRSRQIKSAVLRGLRSLHQGARAGPRTQTAVGPHLRDAREHGIGSFDRLHRKNVAARNHYRLSYVEFSRRAQILKSQRNVSAVEL